MIDAEVLPHFHSLNAGQKAARKLAFSFLDKLTKGSLTIHEFFNRGQTYRVQFGESHSIDGVHAVVEVKHPDFYSHLLTGGSIAAGEIYMQGWWDSPDLVKVTQLMALNQKALDALERQGGIVSRLSLKIAHWFRRNTRKNAERNIRAHYDLSNELYETFLDTNMLYSSALYHTHRDNLEQAQLNKMERLCQKLELKADDHVIEIGSGWGAMAIYMAEQHGCNVTTTTISDEQFHYAQRKIEQKGLQNKITLIKRDYRALTGKFDKLVSIEMIEAVGKAYLNTFIKQCQALLKPNGLMAIQAITITDQRYEYYSKQVDFIQKYIFPGGFLPSVSALTHAATEYSDFVLRDLFDIGLDYARTLQEWREGFSLAESKIRALGFDDAFIRMWHYYLSYCEGGFRARSISTVHMTFQKSG